MYGEDQTGGRKDCGYRRKEGDLTGGYHGRTRLEDAVGKTRLEGATGRTVPALRVSNLPAQ